MDIVSMKKEVARLTKENEKLKSKFRVLHDNKELKKELDSLSKDCEKILNSPCHIFDIKFIENMTVSFPRENFSEVFVDEIKLENSDIFNEKSNQEKLKSLILKMFYDKKDEIRRKIEVNNEKLREAEYR